MIALQHAWHPKLLDSRILKYEHRDGWEMQMLLQHTTRCGPMKITVDLNQIGQSIFYASCDVQRMGRSPSSTSSQSVLRSSSKRQRPPAQSPAFAPPLDLTAPPCLAPPPSHPFKPRRPPDRAQAAPAPHTPMIDTDAPLPRRTGGLGAPRA